MATEFINNFNLNSNNSLTHLIDSISILDDNEPTILTNSHYYDNESFLKNKQIRNSDFLLLSLNCQSFNSSKFDQLLIFLDQLNASNICVSIIALQEIWFSEYFNLAARQIDGYEMIVVPSVCSKHGGLITYIHKLYAYVVKKMIILVLYGMVFL